MDEQKKLRVDESVSDYQATIKLFWVVVTALSNFDFVLKILDGIQYVFPLRICLFIFNSK